MKTLTKTLLYLQMAAILITTALAGPHTKEKHFQGKVSSFETAQFVGTTMFVDGSGTGQGTHLGRFTYNYEFTVDLPTLDAVGSAEFVAANGDSFTTTITPTVSDGAPGFAHLIETHTIVGGTGRFAGATGEFTLDRMFSFATSISIGTVDGEIVIHKN